jgi:two-component system chemotaxis sensor kinase CheA
MTELSDKAREEFFSEAQEIVETLARNLLNLDQPGRLDEPDPALINEAFRAVHTLKGLAGLFGASRLGALAHRLEDVLDDIRLGRHPLSPEVLDLLFRSVEVYNQLLAAEKVHSEDPLPAFDDLLASLETVGTPVKPAAESSMEYELDPGMLAVLTEYEEHRLRSNIQQGMNLFRLRVEFDLNTIDKALDEIKERAKLHGEIITYLPTGEMSSPDSIQLDLLLASKSDLDTLTVALGGEHVVVEAIPRRPEQARALRPSLVPSLPAQPPRAPPPSEHAEVVPVQARADVVETSLRSVSQTVRVDIRRLDHLMNIVGELAIVRGAVARMAERLRNEGQRRLATELGRVYRSFDRRLTEMQDGILEVRMVPLGQIFDRLARVVRQLSREAGKEIRLVITGGETEIDKLIVEELSDPLMHMIRNAIDHGVESSEQRHRLGKPQAGTIALNAFQKGNHVMIEIEDDGAGIDEAALLERAVQMGKFDPADAADLSRDEVLALIFLPGLSTRKEASDLSGRGVGMDVVKTNISRMGGVIDVQSERGIGTKITITLPITLAIVSALLLDVAGHAFAIPLSSVSEALRFDGSGVRLVDSREVMTLRGTTLPLCRLDRLLQLRSGDRRLRQFVVVASLGNRRLGLVVDHLYGQQDIVIKPLGKTLAKVRGFSGATELGDQRVGLVLDAAALIEEVLAGVESREAGREGAWLTS